MSRLAIATVGDPMLRERAPEMSVPELRSPQVQRLIDDLIETRRAAGGAGLAAPQVSVPVRVITMFERYQSFRPLSPDTAR